MRKAWKIAPIIVSVIAFITLAGAVLYWFFIGSRIQDGGRMENPDAYRAEKNLVEFAWRQSHRDFYSSFSLKFYQENDMPLLTGWFPSQSGGSEVRECGADAFSNPVPWQLTWVQWFELQNMLAESEPPAYPGVCPDGGWKCPECGMPNGSSVFCAACGASALRKNKNEQHKGKEDLS